MTRLLIIRGRIGRPRPGSRPVGRRAGSSVSGLNGRVRLGESDRHRKRREGGDRKHRGKEPGSADVTPGVHCSLLISCRP